MMYKFIKMKRIFIAHTISGNEKENIAKVLDICRKIHTESLEPLFPSFLWRQYNVHKDILYATIESYFSSGFIHELWIYGPILSEGMKKEIILAKEYNVKIVLKECSDDVKQDVTNLLVDISNNNVIM